MPSDRPTTLLVHTVATSHWTSADDLAGELRARLPDLDLRVARTPAESREGAADAEILVASLLPDELIRANVRWVQATSAGVDFYDLDALEEAGVTVTTAAGVHAEPIAEQTLGYMLAFERGIDRGIRQQSRGVWERYEGGELRGKTLGIVGVGAIGTRAAELADAFDMRVVGTKRDPSTAPDVVDEVHGPDGLFDVLVEADYVLVSCPLTDETRGLLSYDELGAMKDSAVLINVARGPIVDESALETALQQRMIRGAALDVFETEPLPPDSVLWDLSNAVITPHMAGSTPRKHERMAEIFVENYETFVAGDVGAMRNRVV